MHLLLHLQQFLFLLSVFYFASSTFILESANIINTSKINGSQQIHKLELTGESVVWSLLDETVLFSIYKVIELYFENKKGPLHFCEMALRKYSVFTK